MEPLDDDVELLTMLRDAIRGWTRHQHELVTLAGQLRRSTVWAADGATSAAEWLAALADVETCTAREWIRIGAALESLPASADAFAQGRISYSKIRSLTRFATPDNESELLELAQSVSANDLPKALARWITDNTDPDELADRQHRRRSIRWWLEPEGTVAFHLRLPPLAAARFASELTSRTMRTAPRSVDGSWPTMAQQYADAFIAWLDTDGAEAATEVVVHVRGDGAALDDGTPVAGSVVERLVPAAFLRVMIHDAEGHPINASGRHRHPTLRQKRLVKERDRVCVDCGRSDLLQYDHEPAYDVSRRTVVDELQLRCAPCHHRKHAAA